MMTDLHYLTQHSLSLSTLFVPKLNLCNVLDIASLAIQTPIHYCWISHDEARFLLFNMFLVSTMDDLKILCKRKH